MSLTTKDRFWMQKAFEQAKFAAMQGEVPVGAVIVSQDQALLAQGFNQVIHNNDPTAHAEIVVIRQASKLLDNYRLTDCTLYVTLEPCCMCAGAMLHSRIKRLVYATRDIQAGAAGSLFNLVGGGHKLNHSIQIDEGCMQQECAYLLDTFFKDKR